ncbi:MAG: 50S ribosomal protein L3 [Patescibacteria group bacterium]
MSQVFLDDGRVIPVTIIKSDSALEEGLKDKDVVVVGKSKGKGFTGVMKKWNFTGAQATRGQSHKARGAGSIGSQGMGRVWKGKKMAGRHGNKQVTVKGLRIVNVDIALSQIMVSGPVPGARNADVLLRVL